MQCCTIFMPLAASLVVSLAAVAQDPPAEPTRVSAGASTRVWIMAAWDDKCQPLAAPHIDIVSRPAKGTVSFREGQSTTVKNSRNGTCIGARVTGTGIYYTAHPGTDGLDGFAIEAKLSTGETATRRFQLTIAD